MRARWGRKSPRTDDLDERAFLLASLTEVRYRRFALAHVLNSVSLWTHRTAHVWLVVLIANGDAVAVGWVTALQVIPMFFSPLAGQLGDRVNKRLLLIGSQAAAAAGCLTLAYLVGTDQGGLPLVLVLAFLLGIPAVLDAPTRLAMPRHLVEERLVLSAIGLNGAIFQTARMAGPALGGYLISQIGVAPTFLAAGILGLLALGALLTLPKDTARAVASSDRGSMRQAIGWVISDSRLMLPLLGGFCIGMGLSNLQVALPGVVKSLPDAGPSSYGLLLSAIGAGGAAGALVAAGLPRLAGKASSNALLVGSLLLFGAFPFMPSAALMMVAVFVGAVAMQAYNTSAITGLQAVTPPHGLGAVMGLYVLGFFLWAGVGGPVFGAAVGAWGPAHALLLSTAVGLTLVFLMALLPTRTTLGAHERTPQ